MHTNYYVHRAGCDQACAHCQQEVVIHLGQASTGWRFLHRAEESWQQGEAHERWMELAKSGEIRDDADRVINLEDLLSLIADHAHGESQHPGPSTFLCSGFEFYRGEFY